MRLSTRGCYGLRAMLELALNYGGKPVLMRQIADKQGISRKYLHALLTSLKAAGLVRSVRGSGGGYMLARAPARIKVDQIVKVLEGSLSLTDCVEDASTCERSETCVTIDLWRQVSESMVRLLSAVTLEDLVSRQAEKAAQALTYHI
jgi:Rrf2 family protein